MHKCSSAERSSCLNVETKPRIKRCGRVDLCINAQVQIIMLAF